MLSVNIRNQLRLFQWCRRFYYNFALLLQPESHNGNDLCFPLDSGSVVSRRELFFVHVCGHKLSEATEDHRLAGSSSCALGVGLATFLRY